MQLRGKVAARSVRSAPAQQHRFALAVAGDEPLRQQHVAAGRQALLQRRVGLEVTGGRKIVRAHRGAGALLGVQDRACIEPLHVEAFRGQVRRADARRHQFAGRHDAGPQPVADLSDQVDARGHLAQLDEMPFEVGPDRDTEVAGQVGVTPLDLLHHRLPFAGQRLREQLLEPVGDAGERRVHHDGAQALVQARAHDVRDVLPVADARDAGAAELEDDPEGIGVGCHRAVPGGGSRVRSRGAQADPHTSS